METEGVCTCEPWKRTQLTRRQYEAMRLRALGLTVEQVCHRMGVARATFYEHERAAFERYDVDCREQLWMKLGWLKVPEEAA